MIEWNDAQAIARTGLGKLPSSAVLRIRFNDSCTTAGIRDWLRQYSDAICSADKAVTHQRDIHDACGEANGEPERHDDIPTGMGRVVYSIGISSAGLARLGLSEFSLASFPVEFTEGLNSGRAQCLFPENSGNSTRWGIDSESPHLVFFAYSCCKSKVGDFVAQLRESLDGRGSVESEYTWLSDTEHFGFKDGLSNPTIRGQGNSRQNPALDPGGETAAGEFLFGYPDERGINPVSPCIDSAEDPANLLWPNTSFDEGNGDKRDLGRNGSFAVVLQLRQDIAAFESTLSEYERAQAIGRWKNGTPLTICPKSQPEKPILSNDFGYADLDPHGDRCPLGAHIRRSNPRDTLHSDPDTSWRFANRHRILRRGRLYGEENSKQDQLENTDTEQSDSGLMFIALNASIARQFEHIQRNWLDNVRFGRAGEVDPVVGARHVGNNKFSFNEEDSVHNARKVRKDLIEFVQVKGGSYFFLPGIKALEVLCKQIDND